MDAHLPPSSTLAADAQLYVALDNAFYRRRPEALAALARLPIGFKVGMEAFYEAGWPLVAQLGQMAQRPVFLDLKLHDIPNTVAQASRALVRHGARCFNVHALGGSDMMRAALEGAQQGLADVGMAPEAGELRILAVTILTSHTPASWQQIMGQQANVVPDLNERVGALAQLAKRSGLHGVVCSAQEAASVRAACGPNFSIVTPGIRLPEDATDDQQRIVTPEAARAAGADWLVVGRPITAADDPMAACQRFLSALGFVTQAPFC
jgi:orotidine-5'-phosphate decarboxylase